MWMGRWEWTLMGTPRDAALTAGSARRAPELIPLRGGSGGRFRSNGRSGPTGRSRWLNLDGCPRRSLGA